jgi:IS1 family transposase/transposase-like protein
MKTLTKTQVLIVYVFFGIICGFLLEKIIPRGDVYMVALLITTIGFLVMSGLYLCCPKQKIIFTDPVSGYKRELDLSKKCCPNKICIRYDVHGKGNIKLEKVYGKFHDRALLRCIICGKVFSETRTTAYYNVKKSLQFFFSALTFVSFNDGIRDTARKIKIHRDTVMRYVKRAGQQCRKLEVLHVNLKCVEIQLDELWSFIKKKQKNLKNLEEYLAGLGDRWTWLAIDAVSKFVIAHVNGKRTEDLCRKLLQLVKKRVADGKHLFTSDELKVYATILLEIFGKLKTFEKTGSRGRPKDPIFLPSEDMLYAIVHKTRKKGTITDVEIKVIYGAIEEIEKILIESPVSKHINTSFVERKNLDIRQKNRRMTRKTQSFSKSVEMHDDQMDFTIAYGNFCIKHSSIGKSPAMAIGITDHIWSMEELMSFAA